MPSPVARSFRYSPSGILSFSHFSPLISPRTFCLNENGPRSSCLISSHLVNDVTLQPFSPRIIDPAVAADSPHHSRVCCSVSPLQHSGLGTCTYLRQKPTIATSSNSGTNSPRAALTQTQKPSKATTQTTCSQATNSQRTRPTFSPPSISLLSIFYI